MAECGSAQEVMLQNAYVAKKIDPMNSDDSRASDSDCGAAVVGSDVIILLKLAAYRALFVF